MKKSAIRLCSAALLMALTVVASVVLIGATTEAAPVASEPKTTGEEPYVWARILLRTEPLAEEIWLYDAEGKPAQKLTTDKHGMATSGLMNPGQYYAVTKGCCAEFTLYENASVTVDGGCGWTDGEVLYLSGSEVGTVSLTRAMPVQDDDGWLDFTLKNDSFERREVVRCSTEADILTCSFEGVPYGTYLLLEDGVERCRVTLDENTPNVTVTLPE